MSPDKKSKRQERREKIHQQERRRRLLTIGIITVVAAFLVFAIVWPQIRPFAEVVAVESSPPATAERNTAGDPDAPIKIEEFADFQCPFCERFHEQTQPLLIQHYVDTGKVLFVYRSMGNFVSDNIARQKGVPATTESQDAALAAYWVVWFVCANVFVIGHEEPTLRERFGSSYDEYAEHVGRWLPQFRKRRR